MAQFKVEIDIGAENPLTFVNEDLDEFSTSTFATSTPTKPNFDVFPNEGSIVIKDRNSELYQKAVNGEFDNAYSYKVRLYINNKKCAEHIIYQRPVYNYGKKTLTLRLSDLLNATLNTAYVGYNYPRTSKTNKQIFTELVTAIFGSNAVLNIDNEQAFEDKTVQIPYIDFQSSREALAKSLRLSEHSLILDRNGTLKAVDMLGRNDNDKPIYKVYPKQMKEPFLPSLIADNKFNEIKVSGKNIVRNFNNDDNINIIQSEVSSLSDYITDGSTVIQGKNKAYTDMNVGQQGWNNFNLPSQFTKNSITNWRYFAIAMKQTCQYFGTDSHGRAYTAYLNFLTNKNLTKINEWTFDANANINIVYDIYKKTDLGTCVVTYDSNDIDIVDYTFTTTSQGQETKIQENVSGIIDNTQTENWEIWQDNQSTNKAGVTFTLNTPRSEDISVTDYDGTKLQLLISKLIVGKTVEVVKMTTIETQAIAPPTNFNGSLSSQVPPDVLISPDRGVFYGQNEVKSCIKDTYRYVPKTLTISIGAKTETISFENIVKDIDYETDNPNKNIYSMSQDNTLIQEGYGYSQSDTNLFDGVANEIHETYINGLHSGDIRLIGANYNAFVGSGSKNFANGDVFNIGDLIVPCKDNQGTPIINGKVFKVISSNLSMRGGALEQRLGLIESTNIETVVYEVVVEVPSNTEKRVYVIGYGDLYVDGVYSKPINADIFTKIPFESDTYRATLKFVGWFDIITFTDITKTAIASGNLIPIKKINTWYYKLLGNQFASQNLDEIEHDGAIFSLPSKIHTISKYSFNGGSDFSTVQPYEHSPLASSLEIPATITSIEEKSLDSNLTLYFANGVMSSILPQGKSVYTTAKYGGTTNWYTDNQDIANYYCPSNTTITFYKADGTAWATFTCTATISGTTLSVSGLSASDKIYVGILANNEYTDFTSHTVTASETSWTYDLSQSIDTTIAQTILVRVHRNGYTAYNVTINYVPQ